MAKHLPPSASTLRLLDVNGAAGDLLRLRRPDLAVTVGEDAPENSLDAIVAYDAALTDEHLCALLLALRPGGRLISVDSLGEPSAALVKRLEAAGYTRILVEEMLPSGVLMRGEKPHTTGDTLARIESVALRDSADFRGRYVHLLVRQTPNKPVWALKPGDVVAWEAVGLTGEPPVLLAFSSLPRAVAFMQPAVVSGAIKDVNKVAKFSRAVVESWALRVNPTADILEHPIVMLPLDPALAETPDE
jgi:hypothetical protein